VRLPGGEERAELCGGPDALWLGAVVAGAFRAFGRVRGKQLLHVDGIGKCLAQCPVYVGDRPG